MVFNVIKFIGGLTKHDQLTGSTALLSLSLRTLDSMRAMVPELCHMKKFNVLKHFLLLQMVFTDDLPIQTLNGTYKRNLTSAHQQKCFFTVPDNVVKHLAKDI